MITLEVIESHKLKMQLKAQMVLHFLYLVCPLLLVWKFARGSVPLVSLFKVPKHTNLGRKVPKGKNLEVVSCFHGPLLCQLDLSSSSFFALDEVAVGVWHFKKKNPGVTLVAYRQ